MDYEVSGRLAAGGKRDGLRRPPDNFIHGTAWEAMSMSYRRGLSTIVDKGGNVRLTDAGRPWLGWSMAVTPG